MVDVINIVSLNSSKITAIGYYDEDDEYSEYMLSECHLMQGIEINGEVIYEGDIVEIEYWNYMDCECGETIQVKDMGDLLHIEYEVKTCHNNDYYTVTFEILGNVYENKELVECN